MNRSGKLPVSDRRRLSPPADTREIWEEPEASDIESFGYDLDDFDFYDDGFGDCHGA